MMENSAELLYIEELGKSEQVASDSLPVPLAAERFNHSPSMGRLSALGRYRRRLKSWLEVPIATPFGHSLAEIDEIEFGNLM